MVHMVFQEFPLLPCKRQGKGLIPSAGKKKKTPCYSKREREREREISHHFRSVSASPGRDHRYPTTEGVVLLRDRGGMRREKTRSQLSNWRSRKVSTDPLFLRRVPWPEAFLCPPPSIIYPGAFATRDESFPWWCAT